MSTVGSIVVTNLTTGKRIGSLDKAEVFRNLMYFLLWLAIDQAPSCCNFAGLFP